MFDEILQPGATWSHVLKRGTALRITDIAGGVIVGAVFYNWENPTERYNMPDTDNKAYVAKLDQNERRSSVWRQFSFTPR